MEKSYYTCPIQALYMMKEFGLQFYNRHLNCYESIKNYPSLSACFIDLEREIENCGNIVVLSVENFFKPKSGDVGVFVDNYIKFSSDNGFLKYSNIVSNFNHYDINFLIKYTSIIQRDEKKFFTSSEKFIKTKTKYEH